MISVNKPTNSRESILFEEKSPFIDICLNSEGFHPSDSPSSPIQPGPEKDPRGVLRNPGGRHIPCCPLALIRYLQKVNDDLPVPNFLFDMVRAEYEHRRKTVGHRVLEMVSKVLCDLEKRREQSRGNKLFRFFMGSRREFESRMTVNAGILIKLRYHLAEYINNVAIEYGLTAAMKGVKAMPIISQFFVKIERLDITTRQLRNYALELSKTDTSIKVYKTSNRQGWHVKMLPGNERWEQYILSKSPDSSGYKV